MPPSAAAMTAGIKEEWLGLDKNIYLVCSSFTRCTLLQFILQIKYDSESIFLDWSHWGSQRDKLNLTSVNPREGQRSANQTPNHGTGRWEPDTARAERYQTWTARPVAKETWPNSQIT